MNNIKEFMQMEKDFGLPHAEIWRCVAGYEGLYRVSNLGNVMNSRTRKVLKKSESNKGYWTIGLWRNNKRKCFQIHRLIAIAFLCNLTKKQCVDHINHDRKDNNLLNLRWSTMQENNQNKSLSKNNTSGSIGVSWNSQNHKYQSYIMFNRKKKSLGYYLSLEEAVAARRKGEIKYFGEFRNKESHYGMY